jgi:hypothetical protein
MLRTTLTNLGETLFGTGRQPRPKRRRTPRFGVETLEGRQLLSAEIASVVPKQVELLPTGQINFDNQAWDNGAVYAENGRWTSGSGNTYKLTSSGTLTRTTGAGTTNALGTDVLDFAVDYDGTLWVLHKTGELDMQVASLGTPAGLNPVDYGVSFLEANYDLGPDTHPGIGGHVYALDYAGTLRDYSIVGHTSWSSDGFVAKSVADFSFGNGGNLYYLTSSHMVDKVDIANGSNATTTVMTYAYLSSDWQDPSGGGSTGDTRFDYSTNASYPYTGTGSTSAVTISYGNHYHGMVVVGILS